MHFPDNMDSSEQSRQVRLGNRLIRAVAEQDMATAERCLEQGVSADIYVSGDDGFPLVYIAAGTGNIGMFQLLLGHGAHTEAAAGEATSVAGATAVMHAAKRGHGPLVRVLIEAGAQIDAEDEETNRALFWAISAEDEMMVQALLLAGADPNRIGTLEGITPLIAAVWAGNTNLVKTLVRGGADINAPDDAGYTPVYHARLVEEFTVEEQLVCLGGLGRLSEESPDLPEPGGFAPDVGPDEAAETRL